MPFYLTKKLPPYIFAAIYHLKQEAVARGLEIIDFGMGNPDSAPPQHVMDRLAELVRDPKLFGYSVTGGIDILKKSLCDYYQRRFGVELDYKSESLVTIGAKEGIASLATAISDDKNYICIPSPSYPIHSFGFVIAKTNLHHIEAIAASDFLAQFKKHVESTSHKPQAVIVSYPCNPTTEIVGLDFYEELVAFCRKHQIYIISDIAYAELYFDEKDKPHSILEVKGAKDIAIEFSSISKSYSMAGCRVGFACGNKDLVGALYKIKSYLNYGSFNPLQMVAAEALTAKSDEYLQNLRQLYKSRGKFLVDIFARELGWSIEKPKASMFIWTALPKKFSHLSSFDFCKKMILTCGVAMSPGSSFGKSGEGFVRLSLIRSEEEVRQAVAKMKPLFL
ncbi:MAG: aminotransferase class I/II-fold pyridoxal phosphate-dependent enzyme [Alphaproteobacteria bacterium]|nr:aminotransferase class I/II-fold pyridoxal phosphate-dependent enzyme [Alphaproteobacteria bacterium]